MLLSPHSDDAALSTVAMLVNLLDSGYHVNLVIPFSHSNHSLLGDSLSAELVSRQRMHEDRAFGRLLDGDLTLHWLNLPDALIRDPQRFLVAEDAALTTGDEALVSDLVLLMTDLYADCHGVLAPLGLGHHLDHLIVRSAAERIAQQAGLEIVYYEEMPYGNTYPHTPKAVADRVSGSGLQSKLVTCADFTALKRALLECYASQLEQHQIDNFMDYAYQLGADTLAERYWYPADHWPAAFPV